MGFEARFLELKLDHLKMLSAALGLAGDRSFQGRAELSPHALNDPPLAVGRLLFLSAHPCEQAGRTDVWSRGRIVRGPAQDDAQDPERRDPDRPDASRLSVYSIALDQICPHRFLGEGAPRPLERKSSRLYSTILRPHSNQARNRLQGGVVGSVSLDPADIRAHGQQFSAERLREEIQRVGGEELLRS